MHFNARFIARTKRLSTKNTKNLHFYVFFIYSDSNQGFPYIKLDKS